MKTQCSIANVKLLLLIIYMGAGICCDVFSGTPDTLSDPADLMKITWKYTGFGRDIGMPDLEIADRDGIKPEFICSAGHE